jgi:hypothetical protein
VTLSCQCAGAESQAGHEQEMCPFDLCHRSARRFGTHRRHKDDS